MSLGMRTAIGLVMVFAFLLHSARADWKEMTEFVEQLEAVKRETANPCGADPMRWVAPARPIKDVGPVLIVFGKNATHDARRLRYHSQEVAPGEVAMRVYAQYDEKEGPAGSFEYGWFAVGTEACKAGLVDDIKAYTIPSDPKGKKQRPAWPRAPKPHPPSNML